jgi:hypothetical protein
MILDSDARKKFTPTPLLTLPSVGTDVGGQASFLSTTFLPVGSGRRGWGEGLDFF